MTDPTPRFTTDHLVVIMPAFNAGPYIREAIGSVLAQTFTAYDLLVIDDASTDDTVERARSLADPRVHVIRRQVNGGIVDVLNQGLDMYDHRFIARMDADDRCAPDRFQRQMDFLRDQSSVDLVGTQIEYFGLNPGVSNYATEHNDIMAGMLFGSTFPHATLMARAQVFDGVRYSARVQHMEDLELWLRSIRKHRFATLPDVLYGYRRHAVGVTVAFTNTRAQRLKVLLREPLQWLGIDPSADELSLMASDADALRGGLGAHLPLLRSLFKRIIEANHARKVFEPSTLDRLLRSKWDRTFFRLDMRALGDVWQYARLNGGLSMAHWRYLIGGWFGKRSASPDGDA